MHELTTLHKSTVSVNVIWSHIRCVQLFWASGQRVKVRLHRQQCVTLRRCGT